MHHKVTIFISENRVILEEKWTSFGSGQGLSPRPGSFPLLRWQKERPTKPQADISRKEDANDYKWGEKAPVNKRS